MLFFVIGLPFLGALIVWSAGNKKNEEVYTSRKIALLFTCLTYFVTIIIWINFDNIIVQIQFTQQLTEWSFGQLSFGVDQLSLFFIMLTAMTMPIVILSGFYMNAYQAKMYLSLLLLFEGFIMIVFTSQDLVLFYVSFEAVLIPLTLLIGIWGGMRRVQAAYLLFLYTLVGSLPILLAILKIYSVTGTTHFNLLHMINVEYSSYVWLGMFIGLAIKTPLFPWHIWLKIAHAEANVSTSMVLAGLTLKIATYGYLKVLMTIIPFQTAYFSPLVTVLALISVIYTAFSCMRQTDFKQLVAYSSVSHMGITVLGLFSNTVLGIEGGIILSLAHGFVSPLLFFLLGGVIYDRYHSRTIRYFRGLTIYMPIFSICFFIGTIANSATPLSANWIGEFMSLAGSFQSQPIITALASTSIFLSSVYSIYLYNKISFGQWSPYLIPTLDITRIEFHVALPLIFFTVLLGVYPNMVLESLHIGCSSLIYS